MIVWLASYPRSGNTFVRLLLARAFGIDTYSLHEGDDVDFGTGTALEKIVGHVAGLSGDRLVDQARASDKLHIIKTHQPPLTNDPAIYVVRDGRSACVSYWHYAKAHGATAITLDQVIAGEITHGSWSGHFGAWNPLKRKNTLFIRFEDVVRYPDKEVRRIADFLSLHKKNEFDIDFPTLHRTMPQFFRSGDDVRNVEEITSHIGLFSARHGRTMRELGYMSNEQCLIALEDYVGGLNKSMQIQAAVPTRDMLQVIEDNAHIRYVNIYEMINRMLDLASKEDSVPDSADDLHILRELSVKLAAGVERISTEEESAGRHMFVVEAIERLRGDMGTTSQLQDVLRQLSGLETREGGQARAIDQIVAFRTISAEIAAGFGRISTEEQAFERHLSVVKALEGLRGDMGTADQLQNALRQLSGLETKEEGRARSAGHLAALSEIEAQLIAAAKKQKESQDSLVVMLTLLAVETKKNFDKLIEARNENRNISKNTNEIFRLSERMMLNFPSIEELAQRRAEILHLKRALLHSHLVTNIGYIGRRPRWLRRYAGIANGSQINLLSAEEVDGIYSRLERSVSVKYDDKANKK